MDEIRWMKRIPLLLWLLLLLIQTRRKWCDITSTSWLLWCSLKSVADLSDVQEPKEALQRKAREGKKARVDNTHTLDQLRLSNELIEWKHSKRHQKLLFTCFCITCAVEATRPNTTHTLTQTLWVTHSAKWSLWSEIRSTNECFSGPMLDAMIWSIELTPVRFPMLRQHLAVETRIYEWNVCQEEGSKVVPKTQISLSVPLPAYLPVCSDWLSFLLLLRARNLHLVGRTTADDLNTHSHTLFLNWLTAVIWRWIDQIMASNDRTSVRWRWQWSVLLQGQEVNWKTFNEVEEAKMRSRERATRVSQKFKWADIRKVTKGK